MSKDYQVFELDLLHLRSIYEMDMTSTYYSKMSFYEWKKFFDWKIVNNPFRGNQIPGCIIKQNQKIVAYWQYVYVPFKFGNWSGNAPNPAFYVHPDFSSQRGSLWWFFTHNILSKSGFEVLITTHSAQYATVIWKRYNATDCSSSGLFYKGHLLTKRAIDNYAYKKSRFLGILSRAGINKLLKCFAVLRGYNEIKAPLSKLNVVYPFNFDSLKDEEFNEFCDRAFLGINVGIIKDSRYLRWRYSDHPFSNEYHKIGVYDSDNRLLGISVLQLLESTSDIRISDFLYDTKKEWSKEELLKATIMIANELGGAVLSTALVQEGLDSIWFKIGMREYYRRSKPPYSQMLVSHRSNITPPKDINAMYSCGDHTV
jgi:hypothetical protein